VAETFPAVAVTSPEDDSTSPAKKLKPLPRSVGSPLDSTNPTAQLTDLRLLTATRGNKVYTYATVDGSMIAGLAASSAEHRPAYTTHIEQTFNLLNKWTPLGVEMMMSLADRNNPYKIQTYEKTSPSSNSKSAHSTPGGPSANYSTYRAAIHLLKDPAKNNTLQNRITWGENLAKAFTVVDQTSTYPKTWEYIGDTTKPNCPVYLGDVFTPTDTIKIAGLIHQNYSPRQIIAHDDSLKLYFGEHRLAEMKHHFGLSERPAPPATGLDKKTNGVASEPETNCADW
jgi:hypothetical protein